MERHGHVHVASMHVHAMSHGGLGRAAAASERQQLGTRPIDSSIYFQVISGACLPLDKDAARKQEVSARLLVGACGPSAFDTPELCSNYCAATLCSAGSAALAVRRLSVPLLSTGELAALG